MLTRRDVTLTELGVNGYFSTAVNVSMDGGDVSLAPGFLLVPSLVPSLPNCRPTNRKKQKTGAQNREGGLERSKWRCR